MEKVLLIVDDNPDIIEIVQELVGNLFDKVVTATDVDKAQKCLSDYLFSFIILDIHLKDRNGAEVVKYLLENPNNKNNGCPVVILSGIINSQFAERNKQRFAGIIVKPFDSNVLIETVKSIIDGKIEVSYDDLPVPTCELPFSIPQLQEKVHKVMDQVKKNSKLKQLFSELKIDRDSDSFMMTHIGMLINISTGISTKLEWNTEKTLEKFVYASYLHDMALSEHPELSLIKGTITEIELMKDKMDLRDYKLLFEHSNIAAKKIDEIVEIPQDVGIMVKQHHELPKENGFPAKIPHTKITPLSTVFIVSHDLVHYIFENPKWTVKEYVTSVKTKFRGPHFSKVLAALSELK